MVEVSSTRLYLGNLPRNASKAEVEAHFQTLDRTGDIAEIKLMNGFGFIEYKDPMDAQDVVSAFHGSNFMGERLVVQFARGSRRNQEYAHEVRAAPRPRRTPYRMQITGLPVETSWQDLKDFARQSGLDVVYSEVARERDGRGFVEYETATDLRNAVDKLDNREFKDNAVRCIPDVRTPTPEAYPSRPMWPNRVQSQEERPRDHERYRSRSPPPGRRGGFAPPIEPEYYHRGHPPRGNYSPRRDDYRRRSPPPRSYFESSDYRRSPRGDPYAIPRSRHIEDPYEPRGPPPRRGYEPEAYMNGHGRPYGRLLSPRGRPRSPPRGY